MLLKSLQEYLEAKLAPCDLQEGGEVRGGGLGGLPHHRGARQEDPLQVGRKSFGTDAEKLNAGNGMPECLKKII